MKKLLALVLCMMLIVSVIPTAAFADGAAANGSAIDLSPAYEARNILYAALGILGEAHMYKNAITGIKAMENKDNKAALEAEDGPIAQLVQALKDLPDDPSEASGLGYWDLTKKVAPIVVAAYNVAANIQVGVAAEKIGVYDQATGEYTGLVVADHRAEHEFSNAYAPAEQ